MERRKIEYYDNGDFRSIEKGTFETFVKNVKV